MKLKDVSYYPGNREIENVEYYGKSKKGVTLLGGMNEVEIIGEGIITIDNRDIPHYFYYMKGNVKENGEPFVTPKYNLGIL